MTISLENQQNKSDNADAKPIKRLEPIKAIDCLVSLPIRYILEDLIEVGDIVIVSAPEKTGKTYILLNMALCMAAGIKWLDLETMQDEKGKILWLDFDMKRITTMRRINQITNGIEETWNVRKPDLFDNFELLDSQAFRDAGYKNAFQLFGTSDAVEGLKEHIIANNIKVCFIDTLVQVEGLADENSSNDMQEVFRRLKQLRDETQVTFILIHHTTKDRSRGRGSSAIFGETDTNLQLEPCNNEGLILKTESARNIGKQDVAMYKRWIPRLAEDGHSEMKDENGHVVYKFQLLPGDVEDMQAERNNKGTKSAAALQENIDRIITLFTENGNTPMNQTKIISALKGTASKRKEAIFEAVNRGVLVREFDKFSLKSDPGKLC